MLNLSQRIPALSESIYKSPNITGKLSSDDLKAIGEYVWNGYDRDIYSRSRWASRTAAALDLALQVQKTKTFPWQNCSNVAFPLVTIAALQFHATAYPAIVSGTELVRCRVIGDDLTSEATDRARRISSHMSYQLLEEDSGWEEQADRALLSLPILGCIFKKSYWVPAKRGNVSEMVLPQNLVLDYYAKSVEDCGRKTHIVPLYRNEIFSRVRRGTFRDVLNEDWYTVDSAPNRSVSDIQADNRKGVNPPPAESESPFVTLEQHCNLDLDGDGYAEPYIVTIEEQSRAVLRIVTRYSKIEDIERNSAGRLIQIRPIEYFTKMPFIPSPDGGIYDIGFGVLLGPLNESVNSAINQIFDAGTMATTAGGFLGRGAKIRGGVYEFSPFGWNRVDSSGDDLRKNIFPFPVREPSAVLFNLLALMINYTNRVSGATDAMVGENPGQNTPAETNRTMLAQGMKIYTAVFKRVWRSMKEEFKKLYLLNAEHLPDRKPFGAGGWIMREDYKGDPNEVVPVADPSIVSDQLKMQQISAVKESASRTPGYNPDEVEKAWLKSLHVQDIAKLFPGVEKMPPGKDPKLAIEELKLQGRQMELEHKAREFALALMEERRLNTSKIMEFEARAMKQVAESQNEEEKLKVDQFRSQVEALRERNAAINGSIESVLKGMASFQQQEGAQGGDTGGMERVAGASGNSGAEEVGASPNG